MNLFKKVFLKFAKKPCEEKDLYKIIFKHDIPETEGIDNELVTWPLCKKLFNKDHAQFCTNGDSVFQFYAYEYQGKREEWNYPKETNIPSGSTVIYWYNFKAKAEPDATQENTVWLRTVLEGNEAQESETIDVWPFEPGLTAVSYIETNVEVIVIAKKQPVNIDQLNGKTFQKWSLSPGLNAEIEGNKLTLKANSSGWAKAYYSEEKK